MTADGFGSSAVLGPGNAQKRGGTLARTLFRRWCVCVGVFGSRVDSLWRSRDLGHPVKGWGHRNAVWLVEWPYRGECFGQWFAGV